MRISNIKQYLGGADNVIARDIIQGDQFIFTFKIGNTDLTNYEFDVDTQLFKADVTNAGSNVTINELLQINTGTTDANIANSESGSGTPLTFGYPTTGTSAAVRVNGTTGSLIIPTGLLSNLTVLNTASAGTFTSSASIDSQKPFVVVMSVTANDKATSSNATAIDSIRSFRLLWIVRYRPIVSQ